MMWGVVGARPAAVGSKRPSGIIGVVWGKRRRMWDKAVSAVQSSTWGGAALCPVQLCADGPEPNLPKAAPPAAVPRRWGPYPQLGAPPRAPTCTHCTELCSALCHALISGEPWGESAGCEAKPLSCWSGGPGTKVDGKNKTSQLLPFPAWTAAIGIGPAIPCTVGTSASHRGPLQRSRERILWAAALVDTKQGIWGDKLGFCNGRAPAQQHLAWMHTVKITQKR